MIKAFSDEAWEDYTYWETQEKRHSSVSINLSMTLTAMDMTESENQNRFPAIFRHTGADELTIKTVLFIVSRMVLYKSFSAALITVISKAVSPTVNSAGDFSVTGT